MASPIGLHLGLVLAAIAAALYAAARSAGLVDLVERSIRRGEGDPELAEALRRTPRASGTEPSGQTRYDRAKSARRGGEHSMDRVGGAARAPGSGMRRAVALDRQGHLIPTSSKNFDQKLTTQSTTSLNRTGWPPVTFISRRGTSKSWGSKSRWEKSPS